ncbi:2-hydroxyacid dehydrogenase [Palleronia abyssalis]|uniref:Glyoxylate/hydroxypyruvate reductase A n=1 Tax=Palleronia abyssalis TaxID=1501240 RepID=A0A2R8BYP8_9RHOB|nr:glyoxylate/hydroxypyruvate reductase A [Palleronia abyssalis]SPJ25233.1 Glyoxylate/hydroxypyruvate reductase A [Palleronia abyssalis]
MIRVLFAAGDSRWDDWKSPLRTAFAEAGLDCDLAQHHEPSQVDIIVYAPNVPLQDFRPYTNARAVLNIWAGVEGIVGNETLTQPLARMVDPGLTEGMVEYVCGHVLRHHLGIDTQITGQDGVWKPQVPPLARDRAVTILGLGELGGACATALVQLGFPVTGWSRSQKDIAGIRCLSGDDGLTKALKTAQILVCLLPLTPDTTDILGSAAFGHLPAGAVLINPGRGGLIVERDLMAALETGHIAHATLDTFRTEPLPQDHPFWSHPGVTVTPHIASETRPATAAPVIAENVRRAMADEPILHLVDREKGY